MSTARSSRAQIGSTLGYRNSADREQGGELCKRIVSLDDLHKSVQATSELARSRTLSAVGRLVEAEKAVEQSLHLQTTAGGWYQLALVRFARGDARCSLAAFTAAATLREPRSEDLRVVALDYVLLNDAHDAEKWLRASLSMDASNAEAWYDLGRVLYSGKRYEEADDALHRALALRPRDVKAETYLGLIAETSNDEASAELHYRKAILDEQKDENGTEKPNALPFRSLGILLRESGDLDEATRLIERAVVIAPNDAENHAELGKCYMREELWPSARVELDTALRLHSSKPAWHFLLGRVYHALGMEAEAKAEFSIARTQIETTSEFGPEQ